MSENARANESGSGGEAIVEAWKRVLEEMDEIADARDADGWDVLTLVANHTNTLAKSDETEDRWGLGHIVPTSDAEAFESVYDPDRFTEYLAYGRPIQTYMHLVTEFLDPERQESILIASRYDKRMAKEMIQSAKSEDRLYTHVQTIDGTIVGRYEHETYGPLIGEPEKPGSEE